MLHAHKQGFGYLAVSSAEDQRFQEVGARHNALRGLSRDLCVNRGWSALTIGTPAGPWGAFWLLLGGECWDLESSSKTGPRVSPLLQIPTRHGIKLKILSSSQPSSMELALHSSTIWPVLGTPRLLSSFLLWKEGPRKVVSLGEVWLKWCRWNLKSTQRCGGQADG